MNLKELKQRVAEIEEVLPDTAFVELTCFEKNDRLLRLCLTERLRRKCRKGKIWKSKAFLTALKNDQYGFNRGHVRSPGGYDGIFLVDRNYRPANEMMKKIFDCFLDKPSSEAAAITSSMGMTLDNCEPVRLVSHHTRLLGMLFKQDAVDTLVLVDYDNTKR